MKIFTQKYPMNMVDQFEQREGEEFDIGRKNWSNDSFYTICQASPSIILEGMGQTAEHNIRDRFYSEGQIVKLYLAGLNEVVFKDNESDYLRTYYIVDSIKKMGKIFVSSVRMQGCIINNDSCFDIVQAIIIHSV